MGGLGLQHRRHLVRHRPHALADLRAPLQTAGQPDIYILIFIGVDPRPFLRIGLTGERSCLHRGVDFIAVAVEKAGIDEKRRDF